MTATQEFIDFVLNHPGYFHISKSKVFLAILGYLVDGAKPSLKVYANFKNLDPIDIDKILETLFVIGLVKKHLTAAGTFYYCTDDAKELLEKVKKNQGRAAIGSNCLIFFENFPKTKGYIIYIITI